MDNLRFLELMKEINLKLKILKENSKDDSTYNILLELLLELDNLIQHEQIPKEVYSKVVMFQNKCHYYIEFLRLKKRISK